ncbi:MAG: hypothetical protein ACKO9V_10855 [Candidatus Kapaibacterium sp.]
MSLLCHFFSVAAGIANTLSSMAGFMVTSLTYTPPPPSPSRAVGSRSPPKRL